jgi:hypothetical protein
MLTDAKKFGEMVRNEIYARWLHSENDAMSQREAIMDVDLAALLAKCEAVPVMYRAYAPQYGNADECGYVSACGPFHEVTGLTNEPLYAAPVLPAHDEAGEREEFEAWATRQGYTLDYDAGSNPKQYSSALELMSWAAWQAGRAALREAGK